MDERRLDLCHWRDLDHIRKAYSNYINPEEIEKIIEKTEKQFKKRANISDEENEYCFLNLIDSMLVNYMQRRESNG